MIPATPMTILVLGATGATGKHLTRYLLANGHAVKAIVRSADRLKAVVSDHPNLDVTEGTVLNQSDKTLQETVQGCDAVASCLGHNISFKGIFGAPRRLVRDTAERICAAIKANQLAAPVKYVLTNTTGNTNWDLNEIVPTSQRIVTSLLRVVLPPHVDNEQAADYLRVNIDQENASVEWCCVRPDGLIDQDEPTPLDIHPSPIRNPIFDAGKTSRINVAHFMGRLIEDEALWKEWKGRMPVIYNRALQNLNRTES